MITNHDLVRFGDLVERAGYGDRHSDAYWPRLRAAFSFLAAYTGPITLYYGEETGDEVPGFDVRVEEECWLVFRCDDHVSRSSGHFDQLEPPAVDLRDDVTRLMQMRGRHPALWNGRRQNLIADETLFVDLKEDGEDRLLYMLNTGVESRRISFLVSALGGRHFYDALRLEPLVTYGDSLIVELEPLGARFIQVVD